MGQDSKQFVSEHIMVIKKSQKNLGYQEIFQYFATPQSPVLGCYRFNRESGQLYERLDLTRSVAVIMRQINGGCSGLRTNMILFSEHTLYTRINLFVVLNIYYSLPLP